MARRSQPLPATIGKAARRTAGRTTAARTPLNVRTSGVHIDEALEAYARDRAGRKIGKFATHIERATIRFSDVNGPRGGVDTECKIKVVLSGAASVVVAERATDARGALDAALDTTEGAVRRSVQRLSVAPRRR